MCKSRIIYIVNVYIIYYLSDERSHESRIIIIISYTQCVNIDNVVEFLNHFVAYDNVQYNILHLFNTMTKLLKKLIDYNV